MLRNKSLNLWLIGITVWLAAGCLSTPRAQPENDAAISDNASRPLVVYYSRQGHARMLATALSSRVGGDLAEIESTRSRGVARITWEQLFGLSDAQEPMGREVESYNPIIVVSPIYFMKLSAPGRTFIETAIPPGKDVYVFTTSGGPLAGFTARKIRTLAEKHSLNVRGVHGFQIGKKNQEDFDNEVQDFLVETPVD
jgi:flavodoxin